MKSSTMVSEENLRVEVTPRESPSVSLASPSPGAATGGLLRFLGMEPEFTELWRTRQPFVIGPLDDPYLLRWYVIPRNKWFNVYVHKFCRSDDDRALHDHPWWWVSVILRQGYWEHRTQGVRWRAPGTAAFSTGGRKVPHRVELETEDVTVFRQGKYFVETREYPAWTLFITGPKVRDWGFHCPKGWVPWEKFTAGKGGGQIGAGCGEYA